MNEKTITGQYVVEATESLQSLTIAPDATLSAPAGKLLTLTVDGVTTEIVPGTYTGNVMLTVSTPVEVDYENHGRVDHFEMANAVVISDGKYVPEKSVEAARVSGTVTDSTVDGLVIDSQSDNFGGVYVDGNSNVTVNDATMTLIGNGGNDFVGHGAGITAAGTSKVTVNRAKIHTVGSIRVTVVGREEATVEVNDSELFVKDGTKPNNVSGMTKVPWMLGLTGRVRATNLVDSATAVYNRCHIKCENWGCMSTDATKKARLYLNDCVLESENCGYGAYSIGNCLDQFTGCTLNLGNYPVIMCMEGNATFTGCTVNSGKVGVMAHGGNGQGTLIVDKGTVFNTEKAVLQVKGRGITMNIDDATLNSREGVILQAFPNDDPNMGPMPAGGPGGPGGPGGGMPAMPDMGPSHNEVEGNFSNCTLTGDFLNAQADEHEMVLTFKNCAVTGAITTGTTTHHEGEPAEDKWWLIGTVKGTYGPVAEDKGTTAAFDASSKWTVTTDCWLSGLEIAEGAEVAAPAGKTLTMTVDGKETAIKPGKYAGKIVIKVG